MTSTIVWIALWMAQWFTINTQYNCYCINEGPHRQYCKCELEMKEGVKP